MIHTFTLSHALVSAECLIDDRVILGSPPEQTISLGASSAVSPNTSVHLLRVRVISGSSIENHSRSRDASSDRHPNIRSVRFDASGTSRHPGNGGIPDMEPDQLRVLYGGSDFRC